MSERPQRDRTDQAIDEAITQILAGEPRVTGAAIRDLVARRPARGAVWFAIAASLIAAVLVTREFFPRSADVPKTVASRIPRTSGAVVEAPSGTIVPVRSVAGEPERRSRRFDARRTIVEPWEGLDRLVIAPIEPPTPIDGDRIESIALEFPGIEVAPLPELSPLDASQPVPHRSNKTP